MALAELDDLAVDVDHDGSRQGGVPQELPEGRSLPASDDQRALRRALHGQQTGIDEGLEVDELVMLAGLDTAVQDQELTVRRRHHDLDLLELGLRLDETPHHA